MNLDQSLLNLLKDPSLDSSSVSGKKQFNLDFGKNSGKKNPLNLINSYTKKIVENNDIIENSKKIKKETCTDWLLLLRII